MSEGTAARALAAAAVLGGGARAAAILARVGGRDGTAARALAARLVALPAVARVEELAELAAGLRAPRPAGVEDVHPDWLAASPGDDARLRAPADPRVQVWAERRQLGALVAMPSGEVGRLATPLDLARARADWLALRLERLGCRQLAHATAGADRVELAALAARLGFVRARAYIEQIGKVRELGDAAAARFGPRRAAQERCDGIRLARDPLAFLAIGARAIAPHVATVGGDLPRQIAQRLPRVPGTRALAELLEWEPAPLDQAPAWAEILSG